MTSPITALDLRDLLVAALAKEAGGNQRRWRIAVGDVRVYSIDTHPHCNWSIAPSGTDGEVDRIERQVDRFRERYPIVTR